MLDVFFDEDDKWLLYKVAGNTMLVSHAPSGFEDPPTQIMDLEVAIGGTYEVILNVLDFSENPGNGTLQAVLDVPDTIARVIHLGLLESGDVVTTNFFQGGKACGAMIAV